MWNRLQQQRRDFVMVFFGAAILAAFLLGMDVLHVHP